MDCPTKFENTSSYTVPALVIGIIVVEYRHRLGLQVYELLRSGAIFVRLNAHMQNGSGFKFSTLRPTLCEASFLAFSMPTDEWCSEAFLRVTAQAQK